MSELNNRKEKSKSEKKYSPGMMQFLSIKENYQDYILFFRMGDFYELFFEDAVIAAKELEIVLTSRSGKKEAEEDRIPMCGFPHKAVDSYVDILVERGYKIAICEQVEDPKTAKGVVKREVVQLITPGTIMQGKTLEAKSNNYIATISEFLDSFGLGYCDLTTGETHVTLVKDDFQDIISELNSLCIKEVVVDYNFSKSIRKELETKLNILISYEEDESIPLELESTCENLEGEILRKTIGRLLNYLLKTQKRSLDHLQEVIYYELNQYMKLDIFSKRNLELLESNRMKDKKGSLLWVLDETATAMGGRRLKQWLERPLLSHTEIETRLSMVECFLNHYFERNELKENLKNVYDLERLSGRVAYGNVNAKDLIQLKKSLKKVPEIIDLIESLKDENLLKLTTNLDKCESLYDLLERSVKDDPPLSIKEGDIIKDGYNIKLDEYRNIIQRGNSWISELEKKERELTGIKNLKIKHVKDEGYCIEVTKSNMYLVPEDRYERKQTLKNFERYTTSEIKENQIKIIEAGEKILGLEYDLFLDLRRQVSQYIPKLQALSKVISELDVLQSFAEVSEKYHYNKPMLSEKNQILIKEGRHPVVENFLNSNNYITNDCVMTNERELLLITGPNMSGKSTYMRQIALTAIMMQIGCFVPASYAELPLFDQVFTRIGAADDLVSGQSTFMVEMLETRNALKKATTNSLILLDEIGRGTSTYDGMALAQAIIEYVHDKVGAKTLFSTHYHELTELDKSLPKLFNIRVSVMEENDQIVFIHKVEEGAANKSYGIHVAELADLPKSLILRAKEILNSLETSDSSSQVKYKSKAKVNSISTSTSTCDIITENHYDDTTQLTEVEKEVLFKIKNLNILEMNPMDSLNELYKLQSLLNR